MDFLTWARSPWGEDIPAHKSMLVGWVTRRQYLEHHDPDRWTVRGREVI